jgi:hypothetical protein
MLEIRRILSKFLFKPSFIPRKEPLRKKQQLGQSEIELEHALRNNFTNEKINKAVEKYHNAKLILLKGIIHYIKENEYQHKPENRKRDKVEKEIWELQNKTKEMIIDEFK